MSVVLTVKIEAAEIVAAIRDLITAVYGSRPVQVGPVTQTATPVTQTAAPVTQTAPVTEQQQAPAVQPPASAVPTAAHTYTLEQIAVAATALIDSGRRQDLVQLLGSFGAQALTQLPKEQYGAFATKLREMGAKI